MDSKKTVLIIAVVAVVLVGSTILGVAVGSSDFETIGGFLVVAAALAAFLGLGRNIWLLIPIFAAWSGNIKVLPLPFSVSNIAIGFAVACWLLLLVTRRIRLSFRFDTLDIWIVALLLVLFFGYLRNPVGLAALANNSNVGARPYFEIVVALCGYFMLANQRPTLKALRSVPPAILVASIVLAIGGTVAYFAPQIGIRLYIFYTGFFPNLDTGEYGVVEQSIGRAPFLRPLGFTVLLILFATRPPFTNLLPTRPLRLFGFASGMLLVLLSGFRSAFGAAGLFFVVGSFLWWRGRGLILCVVMAVLAIGGIVAVQSFYPLPDRLQRPLSFLPGDWDAHVVRSVEESTEWRVEMWNIVVNGNSVGNPWIGDGFGFPASELAYYGFLQQSGQILPQQLATFYLLTGDIHSGPLSTFKFVGILGLLLFASTAIHVAIRYLKLWRSIRDPLYHLPVGFFAIQAIYFPIEFLFVYGNFKTDLPELLISVGILRILEVAVREGQTSEAVAAGLGGESGQLVRPKELPRARVTSPLSS